ncbi:hypothetical protein [Nocardia asteroides]|uniref:hypothetical protein n=1 Tax=Nocardia asteroides TaxID=1824 RepID=UPI001E2AD98C|nr:hypothetical protein [Nocardia asteroides]UGT62131.1 hypothetical protein LTT61_01905 [Nocardia asteroides]
MTKVLLALHVVAAIVAIGPVTVAASMFPPAARRADGEPGIEQAALLYRICPVYAAVGIAVPLFGLATALALGVLTDTWVVFSIALTAAAAGVLGLMILPGQAELLTRLRGAGPVLVRADTAQLAMLTGVFNLLWVVVTVLMIVRPGSTTGG